MSRTAIPLQALAPNGGTDTDMAYTNGDAGNGMSVDNNSGNVIVIFKNADASPRTITFKAIADPYGRTVDVTLTVANGKTGSAGPFPPHLFNQAGTGLLNIDSADMTSCSLAAIQYTPWRN